MYQNAVSTNAHPVFLNTPLGTFEVGQKITGSSSISVVEAAGLGVLSRSFPYL
jgi:hypothetical protein